MSGSAERIGQVEKRVSQLENLLEKATAVIVEQQAEIASLRIDNARLSQEVEQWRRGHRVRSRRFSSCPEAKWSRLRRRAGRDAGHPGARRPMPVQVDAVKEHLLQERCDCGGAVVSPCELLVTYVEDIELHKVVTEHRGRAGVCTVCKKRKSPKTMPGVAGGAVVTPTQLGDRVKSYAWSQRHRHGVSYARLSESLSEDFDLHVTPSGLCHSVMHNAERLSGVHASIRAHLGEASVLGMDETGYRFDGSSAWCWLGRSERASFFSIQRSRGQSAFSKCSRRVSRACS